MSDWILVPCLVSLRAEFNAVAPRRDKGADGSIGDGAHTSASDHTPDEDSDVLRDHDADSKNEVHALDIDSSGPWPGGWAWFDATIKGIVARHHRGEDDRLQYVIWNRKIANRDIDNWRWRTYKGTTDPHVDHAHFSARYTTAAESDTSPWGIEEDDTVNADQFLEILNDPRVAARFKVLPWQFAGNPLPPGLSAASTLTATFAAAREAAGHDVDEQEIAAAVLAGLNAGPVEQTVAALRAALGDRAAEVGRLLAGS
jgi:hypothetical protein